MLPIFILVNIQISFRILVKGNKNRNNHWFDCKNFSNYCWLFLFLFRVLKFLWMGIISMGSDHRLETRNRWKTFLIVKVLSPIFILVEFRLLEYSCEWELFRYRNGRERWKPGNCWRVFQDTFHPCEWKKLSNENAHVFVDSVVVSSLGWVSSTGVTLAGPNFVTAKRNERKFVTVTQCFVN